MLGRPFGVPNDAAFQRRVLLAVLRLIEAPSGPVLEDYPEEAPAPAPGAMEGVACPVSFNRAPDSADPGAILLREIGELAPWYDLARERRQRTTVGVSGVSIAEAVQAIAAVLAGKPAPSFSGLNAGQSLKLAYEDIRAYYFEAAAARPGGAQWDEILRWFWHDTAAGRVFLQLQQTCLASSDASLKHLGSKALVPVAIQQGLKKA